MRRLGIDMVRIMSFEIPKELRQKESEFYDEVVKRLNSDSKDG